MNKSRSTMVRVHTPLAFTKHKLHNIHLQPPHQLRNDQLVLHKTFINRANCCYGWGILSVSGWKMIADKVLSLCSQNYVGWDRTKQALLHSKAMLRQVLRLQTSTASFKAFLRQLLNLRLCWATDTQLEEDDEEEEEEEDVVEEEEEHAGTGEASLARALLEEDDATSRPSSGRFRFASAFAAALAFG